MAESRALLDLPIEPYIGLTHDNALRRAAGEGRSPRLLTSLAGPRRTDLNYGRLNVVLDHASKVIAADAG